MKWPWSTKPCHDEEAEKAREAARQSLAQAIARGPEVSKVAASLRELRERNHFAELFDESMRKRR